ncbi:MAG: hypothetical protein K0S33_3449 [Bacteroidetes bacterium]|jgi:hypothetical protein|nr:hypothetical protein [Bacteroidota bacterium]
MRSAKKALLLLMVVFGVYSYAQNNLSPSARFKDGLKIYMNDDSTRYIKGTGLVQIWLRYNENNPGSTVYGTPKDQTFDVGLRRVRYQVMGQVNKKVFFYTQIGINSFNNLTARKTPIFFHDATAEYSVYKNYFTLGAGLSGWNGVARYTSSGVGNILCMDLPVIQEPSNDVTDQFVRKLGVFAKGKLGGFDYRLAVTNPFPIQNTVSGTGTTTTSMPATGIGTSYYSTKAPDLHYQGYFMWQFLEKESNQLPYMTGSYLGKKRVLNIGSGFAYQKDAMWHRDTTDAGVFDTISTPLQQFGVDVFYDYYLNKEKRNAITAYASYLNYDFGPNYIRNAGVMNTANGVNSLSSYNGAGNSVPVYGTGHVVYLQAAYLFRHDLLKKEGTLQPYVSGMYADYKKLKDPVLIYDIGLNWIQDGQNSKLSLDYQSRPIFNTDSKGDIRETKSARRGMVVLQYQVAF